MALEKTGVELVADNKAKFLGDLGDANKAVRGFGDAADEGAKHVGKFGDIATGAMRRVGEIGINALADAGRALIGVGADTIKVAADFESGMNRFASVTGSAVNDAGLSLDDFQSKFLQLGADTQFSAAEAQDAAINLAKGGVGVGEIMGDATQATLDLAAAGELELGPAAEIVAKQLGVWGKTGVRASDVADLLAQAANASTVDVDDLALGLANVGGVAQVAGVDFDELVQTMALIAPGFSSAADAGTSLKTFISRLQPTTAPAAKAMADLGLATKDGTSLFYDAQGSFIGMEAAAQLLKTSTEGLSEADKTMALQTIFGSDAVRAAAAIAEAGAPGFDAMGASMAGAGTAAEQAAERNKGFGFALDSLKGSFETIQIVVGSAVLPILTSLINDALIPAANAIMEFATTGTISAETFTTLQTNIENVLPGFTNVATFIGDNLNPILAGLASVIGAVVVPALVSMVIAAAPIVLTLGAIGLAGATLYKAWTEDWGGIQTTLTNFWTTTGEPIFSQVTNWLAVTIPAGITTLTGFWNDTLLPALTTVWNFISTSVIPILQDVYAEVATNLPKALQTLSDFWNNTLLPAITATHDFISDKIVPLFVAIVDVNSAAFNKALDALAGFWKDTLHPAIKTVYDFIKDNVIPIFSDVDTKGLTPVQTATTVLADLWNDTLYPALKTVSDFVGGALTSAFSGLGGAIDTVTGFIQGLKDDIANIKLPDWMTPGSPMPLEIAYRGLGDAIQSVADTALPKLQAGLQIDASADLVSMPQTAMIQPPATFGQMMLQGSAGQSTTNNFNLTAQYQNQSRPSLMQDVRTMQMLFG